VIESKTKTTLEKAISISFRKIVFPLGKGEEPGEHFMTHSTPTRQRNVCASHALKKKV